MRIAVIDGQGGGIGKNIIERLRKALTPEVAQKLDIIALGTNALASAAMLKAGADEAATGENAIVQTVETVDLILGPLGIILAHSMLGELTPKMAEAIAKSRARKLLIPLNRCRVDIVGVQCDSLPQLIDRIVEETIKLVNQNPTAT